MGNSDRVFDTDHRWTWEVKCEKSAVCVRKQSKLGNLYCAICTRGLKQEVERRAGGKLFTVWDEHTKPCYSENKNCQTIDKVID